MHRRSYLLRPPVIAVTLFTPPEPFIHVPHPVTRGLDRYCSSQVPLYPAMLSISARQKKASSPNQSINHPSIRPNNHPINQPNEHQIYQPNNHPIYQPTNQPINQTTIQSTNQQTYHSINQPTKRPTTQSTNPTKRPTIQSTNQSTNQPTKPCQKRVGSRTYSFGGGGGSGFI